MTPSGRSRRSQWRWEGGGGGRHQRRRPSSTAGCGHCGGGPPAPCRVSRMEADRALEVVEEEWPLRTAHSRADAGPQAGMAAGGDRSLLGPPQCGPRGAQALPTKSTHTQVLPVPQKVSCLDIAVWWVKARACGNRVGLDPAMSVSAEESRGRLGVDTTHREDAT